MTSSDDADLIRRSEREPEAFGLVLDRHVTAVHAFAQRRVGRDLAEEMTAETFARGFEARGRYDARHPVALPWLLGIASNVLRRHWRTERRRLDAYARAAGQERRDAAPPDVDGEVRAARCPRSGRDEEIPAPTGRALHAGGGEAPRLLLGGGWKVTRIDEWKAGSGEMTFERDGSTLQLSWLPTRLAGPAVGPAKEPGARPELEFGTSDGHRAAVWRFKEADVYTAVWRDGDTTLLARGPAMTPAALAGLVQSLRDVGVEEWLRAVPKRAVTPPEHADAVDEMLAGLPLPPVSTPPRCATAPRPATATSLAQRSRARSRAAGSRAGPTRRRPATTRASGVRWLRWPPHGTGRSCAR